MRKGFVLNISRYGYNEYDFYENEICNNIKYFKNRNILLSFPLINENNKYVNPLKDDKIKEILEKITGEGLNAEVMVRLPYNSCTLDINVDADSIDYIIGQMESQLNRHINICKNYSVKEFIITNECPQLTGEWLEKWEAMLTSLRNQHKGILFGASMT